MKHETKATEPEFRCDCVKLKRAIQAKIYEETKYMTWEQEREYIRKGAEEFDRKLERIRAELAAEKENS
jgi:hypothetical protein